MEWLINLLFFVLIMAVSAYDSLRGDLFSTTRSTATTAPRLGMGCGRVKLHHVSGREIVEA
jgi:hypothetical protein